MIRIILFIVAVTLGFAFFTEPASAALPIDSYVISRDKLPQEARDFLDEHYPKAKISMIKVDRHLLKKTDYDVRLTNGVKIEFANSGKWTSIDCGKRAVPEALVHKTIRRHLDKNFSDLSVVKISKNLSGFRIVLSDSRELKYDRLGIYKGEVSTSDPEEEIQAESAETA